MGLAERTPTSFAAFSAAILLLAGTAPAVLAAPAAPAALAALAIDGNAVTGTTADPEACPEVPGHQDLAAARVVLVGEIHGTVESPAFVAALVCRLTRTGRSVIVGLEWDKAETDRVETYLRSDGATEAQESLLTGGIWQARGQAQYGATSEAMLELLERLRRLRYEESGVGVYLFNRRGASSQERERLMAKALATRMAGDGDGIFVVLTGNIHSRVAPGTRWDPEYQPMGLLLRQARPELAIISLDVAHSGGTAWICASGEPCGARQLRGRARTGSHGDGDAAPRSIVLADAVREDGHHGHYFVGPIHASPPAVPDAP